MLDGLAQLGRIAGIAGICVGVLLILFSKVIRTTVLSKLTDDQSFKILRLSMVLVWLVALVGIVAWMNPSGGPSPLAVISIDIAPARLGVPTGASVLVRNEGRKPVFEELKHEWRINGKATQQWSDLVDIRPQDTARFRADLLFEASGSQNVGYVLARKGIPVAGRQLAVDVAVPQASATERKRSAFDGAWYIHFTFVRNTARPDEPMRDRSEPVIDSETATLSMTYPARGLQFAIETLQRRGKTCRNSKNGFQRDTFS